MQLHEDTVGAFEIFYFQILLYIMWGFKIILLYVAMKEQNLSNLFKKKILKDL